MSPWTIFYVALISWLLGSSHGRYLWDDSAASTVAAVIFCMAALATGFIISWRVEWAKQDAVKTATATLTELINEKNDETAALRRSLNRIKERAS